jgi:hypothetical protein
MAGSFAGCWAKENVEQNRAETKNRNLTIIEYLLMITMLGIVFGLQKVADSRPMLWQVRE